MEAIGTHTPFNLFSSRSVDNHLEVVEEYSIPSPYQLDYKHDKDGTLKLEDAEDTQSSEQHRAAPSSSASVEPPPASPSTTRPMRLPVQMPNFHCDAEMVQLIKYGHFDSDDPALDEAFNDEVFDRAELTVEELEGVLNKQFANNIVYSDEQLEHLKRAIRSVACERRSRQAAAEDNNVDPAALATALAHIYRTLGRNSTGEKPRLYPEFDLQMLEIRPEDLQMESTTTKPPIDGTSTPSTSKAVGGDAAESPRYEGSNNENQPAGGEPQDLLNTLFAAPPAKKKPKKSAASTAGGVAPGSIFATQGPKTGDHTTITRNMGECVPTYWKNYPDLVRYLIRRSVELTMTRGAGDDPTVQQNKCRAMESVILDSGKLKSAAINHNCNYSTLHNYIHRALVTIESVMGRTELPEDTRRLIDEEIDPEEIGRILNVKRAPTQARFVPPAPTTAAPS